VVLAPVCTPFAGRQLGRPEGQVVLGEASPTLTDLQVDLPLAGAPLIRVTTLLLRHDPMMPADDAVQALAVPPPKE